MRTHSLDPCNDTAGKTRPCATLPAAPATDVSPTLRGEACPINSRMGAVEQMVRACGLRATPQLSAVARERPLRGLTGAFTPVFPGYGRRTAVRDRLRHRASCVPTVQYH